MLREGGAVVNAYYILLYLYRFDRVAQSISQAVGQKRPIHALLVEAGAGVDCPVMQRQVNEWTSHTSVKFNPAQKGDPPPPPLVNA